MAGSNRAAALFSPLLLPTAELLSPKSATAAAGVLLSNRSLWLTLSKGPIRRGGLRQKACFGIFYSCSGQCTKRQNGVDSFPVCVCLFASECRLRLLRSNKELFAYAPRTDIIVVTHCCGPGFCLFRDMACFWRKFLLPSFLPSPAHERTNEERTKRAPKTDCGARLLCVVEHGAFLLLSQWSLHCLLEGREREKRTLTRPSSSSSSCLRQQRRRHEQPASERCAAAAAPASAFGLRSPLCTAYSSSAPATHTHTKGCSTVYTQKMYSVKRLKG